MTGAVRTSRSFFSSFALILCVSASLAACGGGDDGGSDAAAPANPPSSGAQPAPTPTPTPSPDPTPQPGTPQPQPSPDPTPAPAPGNAAPHISGTASASAIANEKYSFTPVATDADNDALGFSIQNKPEWASFNTVTGALSGTPTLAHTKTYSNIVITVNDGSASVSLPAFAITVSEPSSGDGVTLSWIPPTENEDGSALLDLAGYTIVYGPSSTMMHQSVRIENAGLSRYVFDDLPTGTYYFGVKAFTDDGVQSDVSNIVSKVVH